LLGKLDFITNFISNHNLKANIVDPDPSFNVDGKLK